MQRALAADKVGLGEDKIGWFAFPVVPGGKGEPTDTLGGITGWLVTKGSPKEAAEFLKFFISKDVQTPAGRRQLHRSRGQGCGGRHQQPASCKRIANELWRSRTTIRTTTTRSLVRRSAASSTTSSAEIAGGSMTPQQAATAIQAAWKQGN